MSKEMSWNVYCSAVDASRRIIVLPFFAKHLSGQKGVGADLGCGNGDLTAYLARVTSSFVVGIDKSTECLEEARKKNPSCHSVIGHIERNCLAETGLMFDFAFSNCCFCHVADEGVYNTLLDLHAAMRCGGLFVMLVPHKDWAKAMYEEIVQEKSGVTAVPRYGGRQYFRSHAWYETALKSADFP